MLKYNQVTNSRSSRVNSSNENIKDTSPHSNSRSPPLSNKSRRAIEASTRLYMNKPSENRTRMCLKKDNQNTTISSMKKEFHI